MDKFKQYKKLNFLEKLVFRTCTYLPPKEKVSPNDVHTFHPMAWYINNYKRAFGSDFENRISGKRVLDFGCGFGGYVIAMGTLNTSESVGVEIQEHVELGRQKAKQLALSNVNFVHGSSQLLPDSSFDIVTSHDAFEHFEEPAKILDEMIRLVKPGGKVLVKFGPTWLSPWGKHMNGTFRKDRPWIHVFIPEKTIMRVHSAYHNLPILLEAYKERPGGLNKMTVTKAKRIASRAQNGTLKEFDVHMMFNWSWLKHIPLLNELMSSWVYLSIEKN
jgi:ubiquinone/menaquinone biosynthesis C-methylase UbiE